MPCCCTCNFSKCDESRIVQWPFLMIFCSRTDCEFHTANVIEISKYVYRFGFTSVSIVHETLWFHFLNAILHFPLIWSGTAEIFCYLLWFIKIEIKFDEQTHVILHFVFFWSLSHKIYWKELSFSYLNGNGCGLMLYICMYVYAHRK